MSHRTTHIRNLVNARNSVFDSKRSNLRFLLQKRYEWIRRFIAEDELGIEFGSGAGHSKIYLGKYNFISSDIRDLPWLDQINIDAMNSGMDDNRFDYIIMLNVLHHLESPIKFFGEANRVLKPGGKLIIYEPYASGFFKLAMNMVKHEHCNDNATIFSADYSLSDESRNFRDGNNSVGKILFKNPDNFLKLFPQYTLLHKSYAEFLIFLNSGGVYTDTFHVPVAWSVNKLLNTADNLLVKLNPDIFALAVRVVLVKSQDSLFFK